MKAERFEPVCFPLKVWVHVKNPLYSCHSLVVFAIWSQISWCTTTNWWQNEVIIVQIHPLFPFPHPLSPTSLFQSTRGSQNPCYTFTSNKVAQRLVAWKNIFNFNSILSVICHFIAVYQDMPFFFKVSFVKCYYRQESRHRPFKEVQPKPERQIFIFMQDKLFCAIFLKLN